MVVRVEWVHSICARLRAKRKGRLGNEAALGSSELCVGSTSPLSAPQLINETSAGRAQWGE